MDSAQKQLEALGLNPNEVKVYLASLEVGAATAQQLAAKAAVVRPTAYVAIGGLTKRGLMSSHTRGKKQFFQAERPAQLLRLLDEEKKKLTDRESKLKSIMPGLEALISMAANKPEVKYYEGLEGLQDMRDIMYAVKPKEVLVIACTERVIENLPQENRDIHNLNLKRKNIPGRQINIVDNIKKIPKPVIDQENWKTKGIKRQGFEFHGEIASFGEYLVMVLHGQNPFGVTIKCKDIAATFNVLFEIAWSSGKLVIL